MTELVLVAMISAAGALVAALMTQLLAARAADRQAARTESTEARRVQQSEASLLRERRRADLTDLWTSALRVLWRISDQIDSGHWRRQGRLEESASGAAAHVYAVALVGLPGVREQAKAFYEATSRYEGAPDHTAAVERAKEWRVVFEALEQAVKRQSDEDLAYRPESP